MNRLTLALFQAAARRYGVTLERFLLDLVAAQKGWRMR